ncbi:MAG: FAD-dependent oxidoreductase, partial [Actinomycetota bacterium]|nr:FAD-dependent oxidoreductase [Actinomycetota bacterium]
MNTRRAQIVVLGGGYAGTMAANRLGALTTAGDDTAEVVLVNPRPRFVHRIRLHQWVTGTGIAEHEYAEVLGAGVRLVVDTATRIDPAAGHVELASGQTLPYDHLVYAVGSTSQPVEPIPGGAEYGFPIAEWEAAQRLREHLAEVAPAAPTTVVGGGLTGLEMATELAEAGRSVRLVCRGA